MTFTAKKVNNFCFKTYFKKSIVLFYFENGQRSDWSSQGIFGTDLKDESENSSFEVANLSKLKLPRTGKFHAVTVN
jgi:hypothetical protein